MYIRKQCCGSWLVVVVVVVGSDRRSEKLYREKTTAEIFHLWNFGGNREFLSAES